MKLSVVLVACLLFLSCKSKAPHEAEVSKDTPKPASSSDLTWADAQSRKARLSNIIYDLKVDIASSTREFIGEMHIDFDLTENSQPLRLDFFEGRTMKIELNGTAVAMDAKKPFWIELPATVLKVGANKLNIIYAHDFANDGQGLHRFVDPEDKKVYLYTQFESYDANRFMPCFDQPDLRAQLKLQVLAPKNWEVISTTRETSKQRKAITQLWDFPITPKISTYLFSLHAGDYQVFQDHFGKIPLRLFARQSLAKYVDSKKWFLITKQGLGFYEKYFGVPYPFQKYDQVIVPEFNMGGMENVAAVTYTEWVVPRSKPTREMDRNLAGLLLHEMAHMWFGDLVTMAWWNDVWLNESFATLMGNTAVAEATMYKEQWQSFAAETKRGAYLADALKTTHPIEAPITRVKEAESNFDGITYGKGASVMKQLRHYMTPEAFRRGIQSYMKTYAYQNTTLENFMGSLQAETKQDLKVWSDRWLRQSGTDAVQVIWNCEGNVLKKMTVEITPSTGAQFRPQALEIGLFNPRGKNLHATAKVRAEINENKPLVLEGNWKCPTAVYPNYEDHGYVNVKLDDNSLQSLQKDLVKVDDLLVRSLIWNDLWRMVRNFELPLRSFVETLNANFDGEKDQIILHQLVEIITSNRGGILSYWPTHTPELLAERERFRSRMEDRFLAQIKSKTSGSDEEKFWFDGFLQISESKKALDQLSGWLEAGQVSAEFKLDVDRQWGIVYSLKRFQYAGADAAFTKLQKADTSDRGQKAALGVQAVVPEVSVKQRWITDMLASQSTKSLASLQAVMSKLFPQEQWPMKAGFENTFYEFLKRNKTSEEENRVQTIVRGLNPLRCEKEASQKLQAHLNEDRDINPGLLKSLNIGLEEDERCQKIRSLF